MSTSITCPNCGTSFEPTAALTQGIEAELRKQYNQKWIDDKKKQEDLWRQREGQIQEELTKKLSQKLQTDYDLKFRNQEEANKLNEEKLAEARRKERDYQQQVLALKTKGEELEIQMGHKLLEERGKMAEDLSKQQEEKNKLRDAEHQMKVKELEKQLEDQRKLADEMRRKAEQGSMQLQGEVQELALEELLRISFPFDLINEVPKGKKGADCIVTVRNSFGQECGKVVFESKRTTGWGKDWIEKIKDDARRVGADAAILVSKIMPDGMDCFGERQGVWICTFSEVKALFSVVRDMVIKVFNASKSQENKSDKAVLLYNYMISPEFSGQWQAIREGFMSIKMSIQNERDQMEKLWKKREIQMEKALLGVSSIRGAIEGFAGDDTNEMSFLADKNDYLLD